MPDQQTSSWRLRASVHATAVGEDFVFLDVAADGYFCLPGAAETIRLGGDRRALTIEDAETAELLRDADLIEVDQARDRRSPVELLPNPGRSAISADIGPPAWRDVGEAGRSLWDLFWRYRGRTFCEIVDQAGMLPWPALTAASSSLEEIVDRFHCWSPYLPVSGKCLIRSFMLLCLLRRHGHRAAWVFGVRTWPFHAHCWLQTADLVLDDQADRVRAYTPIMVV